MDIEIDITHTQLETERLRLRTWQDSDLQDFYEYSSVPGVGEMAGWKHHESMDSSREILQAFILENSSFAIVHKEDNKVIGSIGFKPSWTNDDPAFSDFTAKEIGYALAKDYWGHGLMVEAARAVINFCFHEHALDIVTCGHFLSNHQSQRVIEKLGFQYVKTSDDYAAQLQKTFPTKKYILFHPLQKNEA